MKTKEAIKVLEEFNLWRRGEIDEQPHSPTEIGKAIEKVIELLKDKGD